MSLSTLTSAACLLLSSSFSASISSAATATFGTGTDITGTVTVSSGQVSVDLDLSNFNISTLPTGSACIANGLKYHIHSKWTYNDTMDRLGSSECGALYTGNHYDPWTGCSSSTGNDYCLDSSTSINGCVPGSVSWESGNLGYSCDSSNYTMDPYVCEVGDWSGKYGILNVSSNGNNNAMLLSSVGSSAWEVESSDLDGLSVVFHCNDASSTRAFCAPFEDTSDNSDSTTGRDTQTSSSSMKATFDELEDSYVLLNNDNTYDIQIDISNLDIPSNCGNIVYRVYTALPTHTHVVIRNTTSNSGRRLLQNGTTQAPATTANNNNNNNNTQAPQTTAAQVATTVAPIIETTSMPTGVPTEVPLNCSSLVDSFYDPTVTCASDSEYLGTYCYGLNGNLKKCDNVTYNYNCNNTNNMYSCAPGDLSGKYGKILSNEYNNGNESTTTYIFDGSDELMISLQLLESKYIVLQCENDVNTILTCAEFEEYSSGHSSHSSKDSGSLWWVWVIVVVGVLLLIGGGVFAYKQCNSGDSYQKIQSD